MVSFGDDVSGHVHTIGRKRRLVPTNQRLNASWKSCGEVYAHVGILKSRSELHRWYIPMVVKILVDLGTIYEGDYEKMQIKLPEMVWFYPIFFIILLIHCEKKWNFSHPSEFNIDGDPIDFYKYRRKNAKNIISE